MNPVAERIERLLDLKYNGFRDQQTAESDILRQAHQELAVQDRDVSVLFHQNMALRGLRGECEKMIERLRDKEDERSLGMIDALEAVMVRQDDIIVETNDGPKR